MSIRLVNLVLNVLRRHGRTFVPLAGSLFADFLVGSHVSGPAAAVLSWTGGAHVQVNMLHVMTGIILLVEWTRSLRVAEKPKE